MISLIVVGIYFIFATVIINAMSYFLKQWTHNRQGSGDQLNDNDLENKTMFNTDMSAGSVFTLTFVNIFGINIFLSILTQRIINLLANHFLDPLPPNASTSMIMMRGNNLAILPLTSIWLFQLLYIVPLCRYFYIQNQWAKVRKAIMVCILTLLITLPPFVLSMYNLSPHFKRI